MPHALISSTRCLAEPDADLDPVRACLAPDLGPPGLDVVHLLDLVDHRAARQQLAVVVAAVDTRDDAVDASPDANGIVQDLRRSLCAIAAPSTRSIVKLRGSGAARGGSSVAVPPPTVRRCCRSQTECQRSKGRRRREARRPRRPAASAASSSRRRSQPATRSPRSYANSRSPARSMTASRSSSPTLRAPRPWSARSPEATQSSARSGTRRVRPTTSSPARPRT
jgi:hypothetical protein